MQIFNPYNAKAYNFHLKHKDANDISKSSKPCHVGIHWKSSHWVLSDEDPYAMVSVIFQGFFLHNFVLAKLATSSCCFK